MCENFNPESLQCQKYVFLFFTNCHAEWTFMYGNITLGQHRERQCSKPMNPNQSILDYWSVNKWNIESLAKYPTINYAAFGCNNMSTIFNYQILADRFVLNLKKWKNSRFHFCYWHSTIGHEVRRNCLAPWSVPHTEYDLCLCWTQIHWTIIFALPTLICTQSNLPVLRIHWQGNPLFFVFSERKVKDYHDIISIFNNTEKTLQLKLCRPSSD